MCQREESNNAQVKSIEKEEVNLGNQNVQHNNARGLLGTQSYD